ncbi:MAG: hypothetical protein KatS3mg105_4891 [Gemmatales bacterium]|nr:MAG: hypothetical protein KatS3mg105_4891 [Gemmatales bacterium]
MTFTSRFVSALLTRKEPAWSNGFHPDPWQYDLLHSQARQILLNCARQSGKSTAAAALALGQAHQRPGSLILVVAPSLRQSSELLRKVKEIDRAQGCRVARRRNSNTLLEFANHSRVVSLPGCEATIRTFSSVELLLIDEAARVPEDLYASVRPMLAVSWGRLVCLSTPFGQRGFFWREWVGDGDWLRICVPWQKCPRISADFIESERRSLGDAWIRQEYECSFEALEGLVYPDFAEQCAYDTPLSPIGRAVGGIDFGFRNPFCALWGVLDRDGVLWILHERYVRGQGIHEHASALPKDVLWFADPAGRTEIEALRHAGLVVRQGRNNIRAGIAAVTARLRQGRLKVYRPACPNLFAEAQLYRYESCPHTDNQQEIPLDAHNHALDALRYLVSRLP